MHELERRVQHCTKCKQEKSLSKIIKYHPVYSFGDPSGKDIMVVGQNPSAKEYAKGFLSNDRSIPQRRKTQLTYFEHDETYTFFTEIRKFFGGEVKERMKWIDSPWERVAYLDLVKCPTTCAKGQWSKLSEKQQELLTMNCQDYLKEQLRFYKPKIILPYGTDVGRWFASYLNVEYEQYEDITAQLDDKIVYLLFVPQRQGPHSTPEISWIQNKMLRILEHQSSPHPSLNPK